MKLFALVIAAALAVPPVAATAATYTYDIVYSGSNVAALAVGSDDPLSTVLVTGDTFTYRLAAAGTGAWSTIASGSIFPFFALTGSFNSTSLTYALDLKNNGASVFSFGETTSVCCAHLGTNTVAIGSGLVFDEYTLTGTIANTSNTAPASSLLPWPGIAPEAYAPSVIAFSPGVPEPAAWGLMIGGFGLVGAAARHRRSGFATA